MAMRSPAPLAVLATLGCLNPRIEGDWLVRITDLESLHAVEGQLTLERRRSELEGDLDISMFEQCSDAAASASGHISDDRVRVELDVEFDDYECDGDDYTIYNLYLHLVVLEQAGEIAVLHGDGSWGLGDVDFLAER